MANPKPLPFKRRVCEVDDCPNHADGSFGRVCSEHQAEMDRIDSLRDAAEVLAGEMRRGK